MAAQGLPRATQDLDIFVSPEISNLEALKRALQSVFKDPHIEEIDPAELAADYPAVEYTPPHGPTLKQIARSSNWVRLPSESPHPECCTE